MSRNQCEPEFTIIACLSCLAKSKHEAAHTTAAKVCRCKECSLYSYFEAKKYGIKGFEFDGFVDNHQNLSELQSSYSCVKVRDLVPFALGSLKKTDTCFSFGSYLSSCLVSSILFSQNFPDLLPTLVSCLLDLAAANSPLSDLLKTKLRIRRF